MRRSLVPRARSCAIWSCRSAPISSIRRWAIARAAPACRTAPTAPPARRRALASCGLRGKSWEGSMTALPARARCATWAPWLVISYSRRRGRPSTAAASSQREVSRPKSSSRLKALYRVPWAVKERDPLCSRIVWARPNPWKVACPARSSDSATSRISLSRGSRVPGLRRGTHYNRKISSYSSGNSMQAYTERHPRLVARRLRASAGRQLVSTLPQCRVSGCQINPCRAGMDHVGVQS